MKKKGNVLPLDREIQTLRFKIKSSNRETVEECERLRAEIQRLYFDLARATRPGRHASKRGKIKEQKKKNNKPITPEVIPPDLDLNEYLNAKEEVAAGNDKESSNGALIPSEKVKASNTLVPSLPETVIHPDALNVSNPCNSLSRNLRERDKTIEERFAIVAKRMQERRRQWLESQQKKRPWWKLW